MLTNLLVAVFPEFAPSAASGVLRCPTCTLVLFELHSGAMLKLVDIVSGGGTLSFKCKGGGGGEEEEEVVTLFCLPVKEIYGLLQVLSHESATNTL